MEEKKIITLEEQVGVDCEVVNLKYEYPGYTGEERYGIITELTEKELKEKYGELLEQYEPFILLPLGMSKVRRDYKRNEDKFYKRSVRGHIYSIEDDFEQHHPELCLLPEEDTALQERIEAVLASLKRKQERRVRLFFFDGYTGQQIAKMENLSYQTVYKSITLALKKIKKILEKG